MSGVNETTSAAVSKYVPPAAPTTGALGLEAGNKFIFTGQGALRFITRMLLPVVAAAWLILHVGIKGLLLLAVAAGLYGYFVRRKYFWSCA